MNTDLGISLIWVLIVCNIGYREEHMYMREQMIKVVTGGKSVNLHAKNMNQDQTAPMEQYALGSH